MIMLLYLVPGAVVWAIAAISYWGFAAPDFITYILVAAASAITAVGWCASLISRGIGTRFK